METLLQLIKLVNKNRLQRLQILGQRKDLAKSRLAEFYWALSEEKFHTDEDAAKHFFAGLPSDPEYRKLKSQLKNRLIDLVFFLDTKEPNYTKEDRAYCAAWKEWAAAKILFSRGASLIGVDIAKRVLKHSREFEFTDLSANICKVLRSFYATRMPDTREYERYNELFKYYQNLSLVESQAEEFYTHLATFFSCNQSQRQDKVNSLVEQYLNNLEGVLEHHDSYRLVRFVNLIRLIGLMNRHVYQEALVVADNAIELLSQKSWISPNTKSIFLYQKLVCHTQLQEYKKGRLVAEQCLTLEKPGSFNWYKNRELSLFLALHTKEYDQAFAIFIQAVDHPGFRRLDTYTNEFWKIFEAYLHYLYYVGKIQDSEASKRFRKFRMAKFINEVPVFSRDKRGMNIPILIIQILFTIALGKYDYSIERIEAIEKYCKRYLRRDDTYRANCFIHLLLQIPQAGFHRLAVIRRAANFRAKLDEVPLAISEQRHEIEIIPYEDLWEMALESLTLRIYNNPHSQRGSADTSAHLRRASSPDKQP